ncbi:phosphotransferase [Glycomyces harbinensis]|uniref:Phosphotransferase enzyme family protein n=1 Tax=Glycomyces harbinensis TaxID=58114 RepID=A0A1G7BZ11_9ACTN|nr:phosphotransferase [Glycomyces harbinensis]SDE32292.1 Phosphotransferase enzyme family protein [Glycomyces harbinensis]
MSHEVPLPGGFINEVVLKDGSVRRPVGPHTPFVHRLLEHFERRGWDGAPRLLGIDEDGREKLRFIDGHVAIESGRSAYAESDASLVRLATMVREFHDLCADTDLAGDAETVCHNDLAPKNTVYAHPGPGAPPIALIDWDGAAPGERLHDIAHLCWEFLRLGTPVTDVGETARRMRLVCDAYGLDADRRARLVETVLWWQDRCWRGIEDRAAAGDPAMIRIRDLGAPVWIRGDYDWVQANRAALEAAL